MHPEKKLIEVVDLVPQERYSMDVYGICGCARVGKTTVARIISEKLTSQGKKCLLLSFASPLKDGLGIMGITKEENYDLYRHLAQYIGTNCIRDKYPDWWVNLMEKNIASSRKHNEDVVIVIDDIRFRNELELLNGYENSKRLFVYGGTGRIDLNESVYGHDSESLGVSLEKQVRDFDTIPDSIEEFDISLNVIDNRLSLEGLKTFVYDKIL